MFWAPEPATAVFIPITSPFIFTNGPPELPWLIAASVWNKLVNDSADVASPAVIGRLKPKLPVVTVFWNSPRRYQYYNAITYLHFATVANFSWLQVINTL